MSNYKKAFPDFKLGFELPSNWKDVSWHNDVCPSFRIDRLNSSTCIFIDYINIEDREYSNTHRFSVLDVNKVKPMFKTNNFEDLIKFLDNF